MDSSLISMDEKNSPAKAFSKQAIHFDQDDFSNPILVAWRNQVHQHIDHFLKPSSRILELNAGTGIDAVRLTKKNHVVHATDIASGMIDQIERKILDQQLQNITFEQLPFQEIGKINQEPFDFVFSNFGGLNCIADLREVAIQLPNLIKPGAYVTWVVMPPICPWEIFTVLKGKGAAFRRLKKGGTEAHLEGEYFKAYYHSTKKIKAAFGPRFEFIKSEGLGALSPPPGSYAFAQRNPKIYGALKKLDEGFRNSFPFNRWADHIIVTFQFKG